MAKRDWLSKTLAIVGTVLVAVPLILPLVLGLRFLATPVRFRIDYLMPFEVFPVTLVGIALLLVAAFYSRLRRRGVAWSVAGIFAGIVLGAISATATGIANSVERLQTWKYVLTATFGAAALMAQAALIVVGLLLTRDLFARPDAEVPSES